MDSFIDSDETLLSRVELSSTRLNSTQHNRFELTNLIRASESEAPVNMTRMNKLQKYITTLQHKIDAIFPDNLVEELAKLVNGYDGKQQGAITMDVTPFQADPDIARRVICGEADVIVSGDSDFAMYILGQIHLIL